MLNQQDHVSSAPETLLILSWLYVLISLIRARILPAPAGKLALSRVVLQLLLHELVRDESCFTRHGTPSKGMFDPEQLFKSCLLRSAAYGT